MSVAEKTLITAEQFLRMPNSGFELVDGQPKERIMSSLSNYIGGTIYFLLRAYVVSRNLGWVFPPESGIQCFPWSSRLVRKPDTMFLKRERLRPEEIRDGWVKVVPDLVVEVVSPHDTVYEVEQKVAEFRQAGVPLIWVVTPPSRTVRIIRADGSSSVLNEGDELSGEEVVPGFACRVADLFLPATPSPELEPAG